MSTKTERLEPIGLFIELLRIWYSEEELVQQLSKDFNEKVILNQYVIKAIELKRKEKVEPHIQAAFNSIVDGNEGQGQGAIEEFIELRTKNTNLQSLQLLLKIVLTKATEKEIVSGLPRILSLMKELSSQEITRREFVAIFQVFVMASILLEGEHKELNKELIVAIAEIADKKPTAVAMSTLASAQVIGFAQFKLWLDSYGSSLDMATVSKKTLVFFKTINRMLAAVTDAATMADSSKLIRLSREERLLVEPIIQRFQAASSKGHKIS